MLDLALPCLPGAKQLKYGRIERERRFLLDHIPALSFERRCEIDDRYLIDTRLRLRRMAWSDGTVAYKLARKLEPHEPGALIMGNLYLSAAEHTLLSTLPGNLIRKRRLFFGDWGIDVFSGALAGLITAEIEGEDPVSLDALTPPFAVVREITGESEYTGGWLAERPSNGAAD